MIEILLEAERALSFGRLEHAEKLYRQASEADPKNSIAVVGLARVAVERSDDLGAYLLARRALGIDPENDAARRLAERLLEVMRTRGDELPAEASPNAAPPVDAARMAPPTSAQPGSPRPAAAHEPGAPMPGRKRRGVLRRLLGR